ncbi:repressor LexA, partial [Aromatoleum petrolei]|nr:repressor LexA [Aromatoleum petrolei]
MSNRDHNLTARQSEILEFIRQTVESEGRPPTRAEVCSAFGFRSPNAAESHLRALAAKGAILLEEGRARGIRLAQGLGLPLIGRVAAGSPILAVEHIESRHQ